MAAPSFGGQLASLRGRLFYWGHHGRIPPRTVERDLRPLRIQAQVLPTKKRMDKPPGCVRSAGNPGTLKISSRGELTTSVSLGPGPRAKTSSQTQYRGMIYDNRPGSGHASGPMTPELPQPMFPSKANTFDIGLIRLNRMLAAWQNEAITIWQNTSGSIPITADTQSYAISERPLTLNVVNYKLNGLETPMLSLTRQEYLELPDKAATGRPSQYYYEREQTRGVLFVWTVPATATGTIEWSGRERTTVATGPADTVDVPAEWEEAVHYGLAHRIASAFSRTRTAGRSFATRGTFFPARHGRRRGGKRHDCV